MVRFAVPWHILDGTCRVGFNTAGMHAYILYISHHAAGCTSMPGWGYLSEPISPHCQEPLPF